MSRSNSDDNVLKNELMNLKEIFPVQIFTNNRK